MKLFPRHRSSSSATRLPLRLAILLLVVYGFLGCGPSENPPNVLVISIDTLRQDHLSIYGYDKQTSPGLDALAREGALFESALSNSNWTLPAHMSLLTGLPPSVHQVEEELDRLPDLITTLAQTFKDGGYSTAGLASHIYLNGGYGFDRGFDHYETVADRRAEEVTGRAIDWLDDNGDEPFFLFLHYFDPHWNLDPPEPFASAFGSADKSVGKNDYLMHHLSPEAPIPPETMRQIVALYDGEIAYVDSEITKLVEWLREQGQLDETIVVIVSDHGEEFGEHGSFGHGTHLYDEVLRIPLILRYPPRIEGGTRRNDPAVLSDLPATLLALADQPVPEQYLLEGIDLFEPRSTGPGASDRSIVMESTHWGPKRFAVRKGAHKLLTGGFYTPVYTVKQEGQHTPVRMNRVFLDAALFDTLEDPTEQTNLLVGQDKSELHGALEETLGQYLTRHVRGVRLSCTDADRTAEYQATIRFDASIADEPFPAFPHVAVSVQILSATDFRVAFRPRGGEATILFPVGPSTSRVAVELARNGQPFHAGVHMIPEPGGMESLGSQGDQGAGCTLGLPAQALTADKAMMSLSEEDREKLRSLGYAN